MTVKSGIFVSVTRMLVTVTVLMMFSWLKVIMKCCLKSFNSVSTESSQSQAMLRVSRMLDKLLVSSGYDNELRPGFGAGSGTRVRVNMAVTTLGPVSDEKGVLVLTCYLRSADTWRMFPDIIYNTGSPGEIPDSDSLNFMTST